MERSTEDFVRKSIRHELTRKTMVIEGREDLEEDGADITLGFLSKFLKNTGSDMDGLVREYQERYPLEENIRESADYLRRYIADDEFEVENNAGRATEIVQVLDGAADLQSTLEGREPGTIEIGEVLAPFEDDMAGIDYNGHRHEPVTGDRGYWVALNTLIGNAEDYGGRDVGIYAEVAEQESSFALTLWDDGPGIEEMPVGYDDLDDLWEEGTSSNDGGFGMYMARTVFEAYGGGIEFDQRLMQEEDVGCAYTIELPKHVYETEQPGSGPGEI